MIANTKQIRSLIRKHYNNVLGRNSYSDKSSDPTMRLVTFKVSVPNLTEFKKDVEFLMFCAGYTNRVKITATTSDFISRSSGSQYLRIKASFVA
jgi:cellulase/cellobiase CelA1